MANERHLYWDADVFLSHLNDLEGRAERIEAVLDMVRAEKDLIIVTSTITRVEVAWKAVEQQKRQLSDEELESIDDFVGNRAIVKLIEFNDTVALRARNFMRLAMQDGRRLRPIDAIHLASASWVEAIELNTYNLQHFQHFAELVGFPIREPTPEQPRLL
jgi:predicted nucleic acid-binding protein